MSNEQLREYSITHGWVRPVLHPRLRAMVNGQSAVRYLRFLRPVRVQRLELRPVVYGRWVPAVPCNPAHVTVSVPDPSSRWRVVRDVELPRDPVAAGEGLSQEMSVAEMERRLSASLGLCHTVELDVLTDLLRVECDREHDVWPNHGECNGGMFNVPFGILNDLRAFGEAAASEPDMPQYLPPLAVCDARPAAPKGMRLEQRPEMLCFSSPWLSVGFSLRRPFIRHLGWDALRKGRSGRNRLMARHTSVIGGRLCGLSGPLLRTPREDRGAHTWTGEVEAAGNRVSYRRLHCGAGVTVDAAFTVEPRRLLVEITQAAEQRVPAIEGFAWTLLWDIAAGMTSAAAVPTLREGRNGDLAVPMVWAGDGIGCLRCDLVAGERLNAGLHAESYRDLSLLQGGFELGPASAPEDVPAIPAGSYSAAWELAVDNLAPVRQCKSARTGSAIDGQWASAFASFRPELGGFSNNSVSVNCHVTQHALCEIAVFTRREPGKPDPLALYKFTIGRGLMDGGGYGYHRSLYLDSDPVLLSCAGRIYQVEGGAGWLRRVEPGIVEAVERVLAAIDESGLACCRSLSGNSGSHRWSSNAMDVVGFGHHDGYVNAWTYRGLRNSAAMLTALGRSDLAETCRAAAGRLRDAFAPELLNPDTGWLAAWRSRDGKLHDFASLWVNGCAIAYGLLDYAAACRALEGLETLRRKAGAGSAFFGLPLNLLPIPAADHMLPGILGPLSPTFENYTDGAMAVCNGTAYLRALQLYGFEESAGRMARELEEGYTRGCFCGGVGSGVEFCRWDGTPTGYEGTFGPNFGALYCIGIQRGVFKPLNPEWWPAGG